MHFLDFIHILKRRKNSTSTNTIIQSHISSQNLNLLNQFTSFYVKKDQDRLRTNHYQTDRAQNEIENQFIGAN